MKLVTKILSTSLVLGIDFVTVAIAKPVNALAAWQDHYRDKIYLVRVKKATKAEKVRTIGGSVAYRTVKRVTLHKGEVVKTWYRTQGGFMWMLEGGKHGKYNSNYHYSWNVNWSKKSFKVVKTYRA
ncbi:hypothetical protein [Secundilactobacillus folii]|uniref:Uncharacterized protein n=1 Tax=Secundilactobacillus folii TaxID=2678357 RepID=A0A7X2XWJ3_9LACO|nr:hypothetical protein [Secundilactobacillus folii]MTV82984.1 hypothetical protein [Secundilactobacillus folii]